uniref:Uncharacterized protein n=1 Tax=Arundo donax TaxID=35708 RepID=A0A0A9GV30_ARUDO
MKVEGNNGTFCNTKNNRRQFDHI